MVVPILQMWKQAQQEGTQLTRARASLERGCASHQCLGLSLQHGGSSSLTDRAPCGRQRAAQVRAHLHDVVTIFHLKRDVLHPVAVFHQVVAHLCDR